MLCSLQAGQFYTAIYVRGVLLYLIKDIFNEKFKKVIKKIFDQFRKKIETISITCLPQLEHHFPCIRVACSGLLLPLEVFEYKKHLRLDLTKY